jgi:DNA-binding MarR family transcriptional regulator
VDDTERNTQVQRLAADLFEVSGAMRRDGEAIARQAGQTQARWQVMWIASTGQLTVPSIARRLGITRQSVQPVADELVKEALASFQPNPDHSRSPLLVLTSRGAAILDQLNQTAARKNVELARQLGDRGIQQLRTLLDQARRILQARNEEHLETAAKRPTQPQTR